jgi:protein-tyrosine-phosphatase
MKKALRFSGDGSHDAGHQHAYARSALNLRPAVCVWNTGYEDLSAPLFRNYGTPRGTLKGFHILLIDSLFLHNISMGMFAVGIKRMEIMEKQRVMFICIHNSARSQMAEAFLRNLAGERFEVHSAGLEAGTLNPLVVQAMEEVGIGMQDHFAKKAFDYVKKGERFDYVITVCDEAMPSAVQHFLVRQCAYIGVLKTPAPSLELRKKN